MTNNQFVVLFGQVESEDDFTLPSLSCKELARRFYASDLELERFLSNAYQYFASEKARDLFKALHHGLAVLSMQGQVTSAERISALSPHTVDPYERYLWVPVHVRREYKVKDESSYDGPAFKAPFSEIEYEPTVFKLPFRNEKTKNCPTSGKPLEKNRVQDIPCIKRTVSEKEDFLKRREYNEDGGVISSGEYYYDSINGEIYFPNNYQKTETIEVGYQKVEKTDKNGNTVYEQVPTYKQIADKTKEGYWRRGPDGDRVYRRGSVEEWVDGDAVRVIDESNPIEVERPVFSVPSGTYWIPRIKVASNYLWDITARGVGLSREEAPSKYTPSHWPYFLQLFEFGLQRGAESFAVKNVLSGLAGNPFAYAQGRIIDKESDSDKDYIVIDPDDPEDAPDGQDVLYCEAPRATDMFYKKNGTHVKKFECLLRDDPVEITYNRENTDLSWSRPFRATRADENVLKVSPIKEADGFRLFVGEALRYKSPNLSSWSNLKRGYYDVYIKGQNQLVVTEEYEDDTKDFKIGETIRLEIGQESKEEVYPVTVSNVLFDGDNTVITVQEDLSALKPVSIARLHSSDQETNVWGEQAEWDQAGWFWLDINQVVTSLSGRQLRIRNVTRGTTRNATIRRIRPLEANESNYGIVIDKHLPEFLEEEDLFLQVITDSPEDPTDITIDIENLPYNGVKELIHSFARQAFPQGVKFRLNLQQIWWKTMPNEWGTYEPTWNGQDCPRDVIVWDGPYDKNQKDAWGWAEDNYQESKDEIWGVSGVKWG